MAIPRLTRYGPPPAEVLGPEVMRRARWIRWVCHEAAFWHLDPSEIKRGLFIDYLIEHRRIGRGDLK